MCYTGGADNQILVWQANFAKMDNDSTKKTTTSTTTKARIRPSMAGGMRGVDVQRVEASAVSEDKQDIEDAAAVQSSLENVESCSKKLVELQLSKNRPESTENNENDTKSVTIVFTFQLVLILFCMINSK